VLTASGSIAEVAARFGVSKSYVARSRRCPPGNDAPGAQHNHVPPKLSGLEQVLAARVQAINDQTLAQLCQWVQAEYGIQVGVSTMWKTLVCLGLSLKKKTLHAAEQARPDVAQLRPDWAVEQSRLDVGSPGISG
jgi:transposase